MVEEVDLGEVRVIQTEFAHGTADALEAGMVAVNTFALASAETPYGGIKQSGFGREGGTQGIHDYLNIKYINMVMEV